MNPIALFTLLVIYQIKHFLADFPLQGKYMLGKFNPGNTWILPLTAHAGVHAGFTFVIAMAFRWDLALAGGCAILDFAMHFMIDRIKASPELLGRYKALSGKEMMALKARREELKKNDPPEGTEHLDIRDIDERFKSNTYFWWALGADQFCHHMTHYYLIFIILTYR